SKISSHQRRLGPVQQTSRYAVVLGHGDCREIGCIRKWSVREQFGLLDREVVTPTETKRLVEEAEAVEGMVVLVEIDPREGSGVIPDDWLAVVQPIYSSGERGAPVRKRLEQTLR